MISLNILVKYLHRPVNHFKNKMPKRKEASATNGYGDVGGNCIMLVTESLCCWLFQNKSHKYLKLITNIRPQHRSSPQIFNYDYIDVGYKGILVTLCWWKFLGGDRISMSMTAVECWCPTSMLKDRGRWWRKRLKPSPTSQSCHQHISSPKSVTNIDKACR